MSEREADYAQKAINGLLITDISSSMGDVFARKEKSLGRENYFRCRLNKHWVYKPTRAEKEYFDTRAVKKVMDA